MLLGGDETKRNEETYYKFHELGNKKLTHFSSFVSMTSHTTTVHCTQNQVPIVCELHT
jgi:hypothetical protein